MHVKVIRGAAEVCCRPDDFRNRGRPVKVPSSERFSNQAPNTTRSQKSPSLNFLQQRQGVWARRYYKKIHNLIPDE